MSHVDVQRPAATHAARHDGHAERTPAREPHGWRHRRLPGRIDLDAATTGGTVAVVGLGYVGLPTALSLLESGARVIGLDASSSRLDAIWAQDVDLLPHDRQQLSAQIESSSFEMTDDPGRLAAADTVIVCVPTPITEHLTPDLGALQGACRAVVANARVGQTIILTSTTYVGCTRDFLQTPLAERGLRPGEDVFVAFSPERIDPGVPAHVPAATPRVVGGLTPECTRRASAALARTCPEVHQVSGPEAAEMTKLLENTFRAVNIALANEVGEIAGHLGLSAREVIDAAATKPYGFMPFYPGPGVGGHCIPCDPHYLLWQLRADRVASPLINAAMTQISLRPRRVVAKLRELLAEHGQPIQGARVHVVGVAYKPGVADVRESPALEIISECLAAGADVTYTDRHVPQLNIGDRTLSSVAGPHVSADAVLVHTRHPDADLAWVAGHEVVLDATLRLDDVPQSVPL
jgi:UDP-N-acetyl-D-glucosamine dehydrogenase